MFISVDLPAPFSPRRACTSPRRRSNDTPSLATTPGKRFVMPRSSRTGRSSIRGDCTAARGAGQVLLHGRRDVRDLPGGDVVLGGLPFRDEAARPLGGELAAPAAARGDVEDDVLPAGEAPLLLVLDRLEDGVVDLLDRARED